MLEALAFVFAGVNIGVGIACLRWYVFPASVKTCAGSEHAWEYGWRWRAPSWSNDLLSKREWRRCARCERHEENYCDGTWFFHHFDDGDTPFIRWVHEEPRSSAPSLPLVTAATIQAGTVTTARIASGWVSTGFRYDTAPR